MAALTAELAERSIVCRQSSFQSDRDPKAVQAGQTEAATVVVIVGRRTDWVATGRNIRSFPFIARESARLGQFFFCAWAGGGESFIYRDSLSSPMLIRPCSLTENRVRTAQSHGSFFLAIRVARKSQPDARPSISMAELCVRCSVKNSDKCVLVWSKHLPVSFSSFSHQPATLPHRSRVTLIFRIGSSDTLAKGQRPGSTQLLFSSLVI